MIPVMKSHKFQIYKQSESENKASFLINKAKQRENHIILTQNMLTLHIHISLKLFNAFILQQTII